MKEKLQILAQQAEKTIDLEGILALAKQALPVTYEQILLPKGKPVRIAVARDKAFCFYYEDSLEVLKEMGAELVTFSPLHDNTLPEKIHGLYLGGGYPELYAEKLSANLTMRQSIAAKLKQGTPCIAECGGFMYLTQAIGDFSMTGSLEGSCFNTGKLTRFGYVTLKAKQDNLLCRAGEKIAAHEFHHWDCTVSGNCFTATKANGRNWDCGIATDTLYAGYPHFHFYSNLAFAENFYKACMKEGHRND